MLRAALFFVFVSLFSASMPIPLQAQETCSQAAATCNWNCNRGHAATAAAKDRCTSDCSNRRTECLSTGRWRQSNQMYKDRFGLVKK